ncbi:MAG: beta-phosphoglucomutase [Defluviitaleaceae bacterium]|nr:beta-phosphoglucomutase [Defluviitaleaceae bacterium]MCL2836492.1 beta-phosphoglucomutase [Defluviitaleaceae bacterium]
MKPYKMAIFDLDGVIVDTAKYHYLAWRELAERLGFEFTQEHNERLKGVSRWRSLEILLEVGGMPDKFTDAEKEDMANEKNKRYVGYISQLREDEILPGARELIARMKENGIKTAIGSASKNTPLILERLGIADLFDVVIDGNSTQKAKPDPEVFVLGAKAMDVPPGDCIVFEDAQAGIDAALAAGMTPIGVGDPHNLVGAEIHVPALKDFIF